MTATLIAQYGATATIHVCLSCGYVREVATPADLKEAS